MSGGLEGALRVPVIPDPTFTGWPKNANAPRVKYLEPRESFPKSWLTDAHFTGYTAPDQQRRLTLDAIGLVPIWMVLFVVDVDAPGHGEKTTTAAARAALHARREAWWSGELPKLEKLAAVHPGAVVYRSRSGGYRLVWRLGSPFEIAKTDDKEAWRVFYVRQLCHLVEAFGIEGDPTCSDVTRLYRLPNVPLSSSGGSRTATEFRGDASTLGVWDYRPGSEELTAHLGTAYRQSTRHPTWKTVLRLVTPAPEGGAREEVPPLQPQNQDEDRVFKRASAYLARMSASIAGSGGHLALWEAALAMVRGFNLGMHTGAAMLRQHFNPRCSPPWDLQDIDRKAREVAEKGERPWGYLRDADGGAKGLLHKPSERPARAATTESERPARAATTESERPARAATTESERPARAATTESERPARSSPTANQRNESMGDGDQPLVGATTPRQGEDDWKSELQYDRNGPRKHLYNLGLILAKDDGWRGCLAEDRFSGRVLLLKRPVSHDSKKDEVFPRYWLDDDDLLVANWLQKEWLLVAGPELVGQAARVAASENRIHPVRDYLDSLKWDGQPRLATWLATYLGVRPTDYAAAVGACTLRAAAARVYRPGCKVDTMLVLQGGQGSYKSTAIQTLFGSRFFTDDIDDFGSKDAAMQLRGVWCIEVAELAGMGRAEVERVKSFISRGTERYRSAYGRNVEEQPRQCIFIGTTNADTYLRDETGNRRFWPVACAAVRAIDLKALARDRDQLWAEAVADFKAGLRWHLDPEKDADALRQASLAQESVRERDAWEACIQTHLSQQQPVFVTSGELLKACGVERDRWALAEQRRVGSIIKGLGWQRRQRGSGGAKEWGYVAPYLTGDPPSPTGSRPTLSDQAGSTEGSLWGGTDATGTDATGTDASVPAIGSYSTAKKGSGTDGTDRHRFSSSFAPGGGCQPPGSSFCLTVFSIGSIGAIGASSQKQQVKREPIGTDEAPQAPMRIGASPPSQPSLGGPPSGSESAPPIGASSQKQQVPEAPSAPEKAIQPPVGGPPSGSESAPPIGASRSVPASPIGASSQKQQVGREPMGPETSPQTSAGGPPSQTSAPLPDTARTEAPAMVELAPTPPKGVTKDTKKTKAHHRNRRRGR